MFIVGTPREAGMQNVCAAAIALTILTFTPQSADAQDAPLDPALVEQMTNEKEARRNCKIEICKALAQPGPGAPISCDVAKTWPQAEISSKVAGGSYLWPYGNLQCTFKLGLGRDLFAKAMADGSQVVKFPPHTFDCNVDDKEAAKGKAFTVNLALTPAVSFEKGQAKSVTLEEVKVEGSSIASAAAASLMAVDKVTGAVSKAVAAEINEFVYARCKEDGIEVQAK